MQGWGLDSFGDDGIKVVYIQAVEVLSWNDEGDIAVKRFPLVLQFELAPARHGCHGRWTMIVRRCFALRPFEETSC